MQYRCVQYRVILHGSILHGHAIFAASHIIYHNIQLVDILWFCKLLPCLNCISLWVAHKRWKELEPIHFIFIINQIKDWHGFWERHCMWDGLAIKQMRILTIVLKNGQKRSFHWYMTEMIKMLFSFRTKWKMPTDKSQMWLSDWTLPYDLANLGKRDILNKGRGEAIVCLQGQLHLVGIEFVL